MRLAIRTGGIRWQLFARCADSCKKMDLDIPLSGPRTMEEIMANGAISETAQAR
jgi:hypothetical protein